MSKAKASMLADKPKYDRFVNHGATDRIDAAAGDESAGVIYGVSITTRGEALGHRQWIDQVFIKQNADAINAMADAGVKSRFTHPSLSGDGMGKYLGRVKAAALADDGDRVIADIHFSPMAHRTPDGDLAEYVMGMGESAPDQFGTSIAFMHDYEAEAEFVLAHGAEKKTDPMWGDYIDLTNFKSPDERNTENFYHVRMKELRAVDVVDEPAANPGGLFHRGQEIAQEADALLSYGLGLTKTRPAMAQFDIDPDRLSGFVGRFLTNHGLKIVKDENLMSDKNEQNTAEHSEVEEPKPTEPEGSAPPVVEEPKPTEHATPAASEGKRFLEAFGDKGGVYFANGLTYEQAQAEYGKALAEENKSLREQLAASNAKLAAVDRGEETPAAFNDGGNSADDEKNGRLAQTLGAGLAAYAASIKLPTNN